MRTDDLDFELPPELIAQDPPAERGASRLLHYPPAERGASRLLHYRRAKQSIVHRMFGELPSLLRSGDLLVFNNTRVIPARFHLVKDTGGQVEGLFISEARPGQWTAMLRNLGRC